MATENPSYEKQRQSKKRKPDDRDNPVFDYDTENTPESETEAYEPSDTEYETDDTLDSGISPDELSGLAQEGIEYRETYQNRNETARERETRELNERPWEERTYRREDDTRENPTVFTGADIIVGGIFVDLVSGETLSISNCYGGPPPLSPESLALREKYGKEMEETCGMPLPDEDDPDL